jgi:hypothetical protein
MDRNILSLHDRIDEEHFDLHLLKAAVRALQERVVLLESEVRDLRRAARDQEELSYEPERSNGKRA